MQRLLDERAPGRADGSPAWPGPPGSGCTTGSPTTTGPAGCFLAGDAAHVHSPAGGQGMNTGIQDGYALGRAFATGQLDDYETRRRPVAQRVVAFADRMTRIATTRNPAARDARNIALPLLGHLPGLPHQNRHRTRRTQLPITRYRRAQRGREYRGKPRSTPTPGTEPPESYSGNTKRSCSIITTRSTRSRTRLFSRSP